MTDTILAGAAFAVTGKDLAGLEAAAAEVVADLVGPTRSDDYYVIMTAEPDAFKERALEDKPGTKKILRWRADCRLERRIPTRQAGPDGQPEDPDVGGAA
jgi:hypothetical protein